MFCVVGVFYKSYTIKSSQRTGQATSTFKLFVSFLIRMPQGNEEAISHRHNKNNKPIAYKCIDTSSLHSKESILRCSKNNE